ncbi:hypothetical protein [Candidatus Mycoplasma haematominutum]|uniref:Uncharacterized protein n=1 Tax=Candidatus Mycoplasma haematominutum 'Birmingham 1' TaxID=1116213 RepID=G8C2L3_9MOLU|nr:hypothetical protein [Candidatus Mycoplasma haematominutum]CCE66561.1 conserved haemoplasma hypothetical protein [Candidatus Mycoplasma haematominutum 'Birmingham 1']
MSRELSPEENNFFNCCDYGFENEVVWGVNETEKYYNYQLDKNVSIDWNSSIPETFEPEEKIELSEREIQEKLEGFPAAPQEAQEEKLSEDSLNLPPQYAKQQAYCSNARRSWLRRNSGSKKTSPLDMLKVSFFKDKKADIPTPPEAEPRDFIEEQHKLMKEQQGDKDTMDYNLKDFPLAEPALIQKLCDEHLIFFNLLSKLQETHTPTDFTTAYHIQDRIAYLLDNQTLLYKELTKKLIKYLEKINSKLKKYYDEITLKQEDLKKINAQISRFNEYDRKTQSRLDQAEKETRWFKEDLKEYQDHLDDISGKNKPIEMPTEPNTESSKN